MVPGKGTVDGYLITDLSPDEWLIIDAFEDAIYGLEHLRLVDGRHGWAYASHDQNTAPDHDWSPDAFAARHRLRSQMCRLETPPRRLQPSGQPLNR